MSDHASAHIASALRNTSEDVVTTIVRLPRGDILSTQSESERVETLKQTADRTQKAVTGFVENRDGVTVESRFWITNMVVLEVDTTKVSLDEIANIPEVERLHENFSVQPIDGEETREPSGPKQEDVGTLSDGSHTYGLEQINAPTFWSDLGTKGSGASVAVLDTGIDADHETLSLASNGWQEWDTNGTEIDTQPDDEDGHGTHVSGTVAGGNESNQGHIGVAPEVDLYHGGVLTDQSEGSFAAVVAGMQWSHETVGADVTNMSLGPKGGGYIEEFLDPLQNMMAAGTLPVASCGNAEEGTSGSPGNIYGNSIAVGASDQNEDIGTFSSGEKIFSTDDFDETAEPDVGNWPAEYIVPDIAAPGVSVYSSVPDDSYAWYNGTSMASPHVAGVVALLVAATDSNPTPKEIWDALEATAWKPSDWDESNANAVIDGKDTRYGKGVIDATAAYDELAASGSLSFSAQQPTEGEVTVDSVSAEQESTVVVTYTENNTQYVAGLNTAADNLDGTSLSVPIEDSGGFPGDHTAWLFDDSDLSSTPSPGDDVSSLTGDALDSATATVSSGTLTVSAGKVFVPKDGSSNVVPAAENATQLTIRDLWIGWFGTADADGGNTTDTIGTDSNYEFSWSDRQARATPSLTVSPDKSKYVGGPYELTVSGADPNGSVETTMQVEIVENDTLGKITVNVQDLSSSAISDATVELYFAANHPDYRPQSKKQTDSNGTASFSGLPVGQGSDNPVDYVVRATAPGYGSSATQASLYEDPNDPDNVYLTVNITLF